MNFRSCICQNIEKFNFFLTESIFFGIKFNYKLKKSYLRDIYQNQETVAHL